MDDLIGLVKSLNKREKDLVRLIYSRNTNGEEKIRLNLFNIVVQNDIKEKDDIIRFLNFKGSKSAFSHLKTRLRNDILNIILFQESNKKFRSALFAASFETKKKMAFAEILYRRGLIDIGDGIIKETILIANKYELYAEKYILLDFQRITQGITKGSLVIDKFKKEVEETIKIIEATSEVVSLFYNFTVRYLGKKNLNQEKLDEAQKILNKMRNYYSKYPNPKIGFWYNRAALNYYSSNFDYENAIEHGKILVELTEKNPSLYTPVNLAGASKDLAEICISGKQFEIAMNYCNKALKLFNPQLNNYLLTLENYFQACFLKKDLLKAEQAINMANNHPRFHSKKNTIAKWDYFKACLHFIKKEYRISLELLNRNHTIFINDKGEFQLGYRLMILMIYIETNRYEELDYEIDSFRKIVSNLKYFKKDRIKIIIKLLNSLKNKEFDFYKVYKINQKLFEIILVDKKYFWQPLGYEIINFFEWFSNKKNEN